MNVQLQHQNGYGCIIRPSSDYTSLYAAHKFGRSGDKIYVNGKFLATWDAIDFVRMMHNAFKIGMSKSDILATLIDENFGQYDRDFASELLSEAC